jgi:hypothetical protein
LNPPGESPPLKSETFDDAAVAEQAVSDAPSPSVLT